MLRSSRSMVLYCCAHMRLYCSSALLLDYWATLWPHYQNTTHSHYHTRIRQHYYTTVLLSYGSAVLLIYQGIRIPINCSTTRLANYSSIHLATRLHDATTILRHYYTTVRLYDFVFSERPAIAGAKPAQQAAERPPRQDQLARRSTDATARPALCRGQAAQAAGPHDICK